MTPERWGQIERLYHAALQRDEQQHAAFLNEACAGDRALRQEVESLLAREHSAERFLAAPAIAEVMGEDSGASLSIAVVASQAYQAPHPCPSSQTGAR